MWNSPLISCKHHKLPNWVLPLSLKPLEMKTVSPETQQSDFAKRTISPSTNRWKHHSFCRLHLHHSCVYRKIGWVFSSGFHLSHRVTHILLPSDPPWIFSDPLCALGKGPVGAAPVDAVRRHCGLRLHNPLWFQASTETTGVLFSLSHKQPAGADASGIMRLKG